MLVSVHFPAVQQACLQTPLTQTTEQDAPPWGAAARPKPGSPGRREGNTTNPSCTLIN